ncbi:MAG TPA: alpha/beta hydrolase [Acidimicrobiales bacterium]
MATYVLIPGAGSDSWYWHLVAPRLEAAGHDVLAVDLPCDDDSAGLAEYTDAVVDAVGDRAGQDDLVLVAQSMGSFTAPLVAERVPTRLVILVAAMTPAPGETPGDWWAASGQTAAFEAAARRHGRDVTGGDLVELFLHDVPPDIVAEIEHHTREQSGTPFEKPWPLDAWPDVPTRFLLCTEDRLFPAEFQRRIVPARLGITPDEIESGHLPALARPAELTDYLLRCWEELERDATTG